MSGGAEYPCITSSTMGKPVSCRIVSFNALTHAAPKSKRVFFTLIIVGQYLRMQLRFDSYIV